MSSSSSSTTTVETGQLSARGREYDSLMQGMILSQLDESGYAYEGKEVTEYQDQAAADKLKSQIKFSQSKLDEVTADIQNNPYRGSGRDPRIAQQTKYQQDVYKQESELSGLPQTTYTKYDIKKKPDPRVQDAINKFGEGSPQVKAVEDRIFQEEVDKANTMAGVEADYLKNLKKFVSGDYSYTDEQEAQIDKFITPIKDTIIKNVDDLMSKYGANEAELKAGFQDVMTEIDKTGFAVLDALEAADIQTDKHKTDLLTVLRDVNKSTEAKFKFEQDLLFEKIDKQAAQQAAFLGLPPGSMAENMQKAKAKQDVFTQLQLELADQEMRGRMGIEEKAQGEKRQISLSRVALASSQGEKKEAVAKGILGVTEAYGAKEEALLGAKGNALLALEQKKQSMLENAAYGNIPNIISAASGAKGFEQAFKAGEQAYNIAGMAPVATQLGVEQQRTFAETTTKQETKSSPGFMDVFSGIVGTAAAGAGAAFSGYNALGKISALNKAVEGGGPIQVIS